MIITDQSIIVKEFSIVCSSTIPKSHIIKPTDQSINQSINNIITTQDKLRSCSSTLQHPYNNKTNKLTNKAIRSNRRLNT